MLPLFNLLNSHSINYPEKVSKEGEEVHLKMFKITYFYNNKKLEKYLNSSNWEIHKYFIAYSQGKSVYN